ncbi:MAG: TIM barrel protein [Fimbriimonadaceae bacterium]|nr:TIM barrel protein [Fimbriimonadaceae bacterium]
MRLGGPVFDQPASPEAWVASHRAEGYRAAFCPVAADTPGDVVQAYVTAAAEADLVIAEVGAWSNPIAVDSTAAAQAIAHCQRQLDLAERVGARCCVNIAGSRHPERWDGPHRDNLSPDTFDAIVETVRQIIDAVRPRRTAYSLETMPWIFPDSAESYYDLIVAIDRPGFAVHLDPVNIVNCPARAYDTGALLRHCFEVLGAHIRSCHAKDICFAQHLTLHLDECRPGTGVLDYATFLRCAAELDDVPVMLEHLPNAAEYRAAAAHLRAVAVETGVAW